MHMLEMRICRVCGRRGCIAMGISDLEFPGQSSLRAIELTYEMCELLSAERWLAWSSKITDPRDPDATITLAWARDDVYAANVRPFLHHCHCHGDDEAQSSLVGAEQPGEAAACCGVKGCNTPHSPPQLDDS
eukprot:gene16740-4785_t